MSKLVKNKTLSKHKAPEKQLKISTFFGSKSSDKKDESKLFTNIATVPVSKGSCFRASSSMKSVHQKHGSVLITEKENIPESIICIDVDDFESESKKTGGNFVDVNCFNYDLKQLKHSCQTVNSDNEIKEHPDKSQSPGVKFDISCNTETADRVTNNHETILSSTLFTPTKHNRDTLNHVDSSPDIICETPGEDTILSSRPRSIFASRSFLCSADSLSIPPGKKKLQTSFKKRINKSLLNVSVQFHRTSGLDHTSKALGAGESSIGIPDSLDGHQDCPADRDIKRKSPSPSIDLDKESNGVNSNVSTRGDDKKCVVIKDLLSGCESAPLTNQSSGKGLKHMTLSDECGEYVNLAFQTRDVIGKISKPDDFRNKDIQISSLVDGSKGVEDLNVDGTVNSTLNTNKSKFQSSSSVELNGSANLKMNSFAKAKSKNDCITMQQCKLPLNSKPKLLDALENHEMDTDQTETTKWISRKLLQHITASSGLGTSDKNASCSDDPSSTTPKKVYEGARLVVKRQAKPGSSPASKRNPSNNFTSLKDTGHLSASVDHAKRALRLEDREHEVELSAPNDRRTRFSRERALQFGLKEREQLHEKDRNVTLENDKVLAELLGSMSSLQENKTKSSSSLLKKHSKSMNAILGPKQNGKINTDSHHLLQDTRNLNASDIELLDKLFGSNEESGSELQLNEPTTMAKSNGLINDDVIIIEDSEAFSAQGHECIEIFDSMKDDVTSGISKEAIEERIKPISECKSGAEEHKSMNIVSIKAENVDLLMFENGIESSGRMETVDSEPLINVRHLQDSLSESFGSNALDALKKPYHDNDYDREAEHFNELLLDSNFDISTDRLMMTDPTVANAQLQKEFTFTDLWQRFTVREVSHDRDQIFLSLKDDKTGQMSSCILEGFWADTDVVENDVVNIIGEFEKGICTLTDRNGLIVVNPDLLLSGTLVVSSLFCARKSILREKFQGIEKGNIQMLYGSIIHSLFQHVMKEDLRDEKAVFARAKSLLESSKFIHEMYGQGVEESSVLEEVRSYIPSILNWLKKHTEWTGNERKEKQSMDVMVKEIHDIEENIWSPRFGLKGKIDMTVKVALKKPNLAIASKIVPLELKTGKASFSSEHKGQVTLYSMMYSDRRPEPEEGILLYLKNGDMQLVPAKPESKSGLIQLRNQLAYYLNSQVKSEKSKENVTYSLGRLPRPINSPRSCGQCPQLLNCSIYQRSVEYYDHTKDQAMNTMIDESVAHLDEEELEYYKFWMLCLDLEMTKKNPKEIWCSSSTEREKNGDCIQNLSITDSTLGIPDSQFLTEGIGCSITFTRKEEPPLNLLGFFSGDLVVVSSEDGRYIALATGFIRSITSISVEVVVDRDYLHDTSQFSEMKFRLDRNGGLSISGYLYTNLSRLMEPTAKMKRLRELIIKKSQPTFELKLSKSMVEKVKPIFKTLNKPQRSAVLKVLMAKDYVLIRGFPGTGKTSTIVALVKILQLCGLSVLLTSYTHSAVDNILLKLKKDGVRFLRLGRRGRIHPQILPYSAEVLTNSPDVKDVRKLKMLYDSFDIIATSSFGINHPIFSQRKFDVCIVDEASQILQPACLGPLFYCDKFVLVGDPKQLPPLVQSKEAKKLSMDESLLSRLENCGAVYDLNLQYRMNRIIMELSNKLVYQGKLECANLEVAEQNLDLDVTTLESTPWMKEALSPLLEKSVVFLDTQQVVCF
ncbi:Tripartite DNA replication factor [Bulinus truncatus]|nr:Tripartite DNA replication factor [Bulinus truncatus]